MKQSALRESGRSGIISCCGKRGGMYGVPGKVDSARRGGGRRHGLPYVLLFVGIEAIWERAVQ